MRVTKSVKQTIPINEDLDSMMEIFRKMINRCTQIGLKNNCSTLKRLSLLSYHESDQYDILSSYELNAISQACGRLSQMKQSIKLDVSKLGSITRHNPYIKETS